MTGNSTDPYIGAGGQPRNNSHPRSLGDDLKFWAKSRVAHALLVHRLQGHFRASDIVTLLLKKLESF